MTDKIILNDIHIFAHHGVFAEEAILGQKFIVSVVLYLNLHQICITDKISDGLCYGAITENIVNFCQGNRFNTLEALSHQLGEFLLLNHTILETIKIKIEKPNAPIKYHVKSIAVEITRNRQDYNFL
jgi:dihydroneopterin aldolase